MIAIPFSTHIEVVYGEDDGNQHWTPAVIDLATIKRYYLNGCGFGTWVIFDDGGKSCIKEQFDKFRVLMTAIQTDQPKKTPLKKKK